MKRFIRMFSAPSCNNNNNTSVIGTSDHHSEGRRGRGAKRPDKSLSSDRGSSYANNASIPISSTLLLLLFDYGAPPNGLSEPSWMLLVSARRLLEDLLISLGVRPELITSRPNPLVREAMLTALAAPPVGKIDGIEEGGSDEEYDDDDVSPRVDAYNETASDYCENNNSALNTARSMPMSMPINDMSKLAIATSELEVPSRWNTLTTPRLSFTPRRKDPAPHSYWGRTDKDH